MAVCFYTFHTLMFCWKKGDENKDQTFLEIKRRKEGHVNIYYLFATSSIKQKVDKDISVLNFSAISSVAEWAVSPFSSLYICQK